MTRSAINNIVLRHKPSKEQSYYAPVDGEDQGQEDLDVDSLYYYGLVMMDSTVVTIFKNNSEIAVTPADVNLIFNFVHINELIHKEKGSQPPNGEFFHELCLPGMTEEFRLPVFFKYLDFNNS